MPPAPPPAPAAPAAAAPAAPARPRLGEFLTREGIITQGQLLRAIEEQKSFGGRLGRHLVEMGFITDAALQDALARQLGFTRIDLDVPGVLAPDASRYARADLAEQWGFIPVEFDVKRNVLVIAMSDPDPQLITDIEGFLAMKVDVRIATAESIDRNSRRMFHGDGAPVKQMAGLQLARSEQRNAATLADALGPPPVQQVAAPKPSAAASFEAQLVAQQMALQQHQMQQQLQQYQLQQMQLQAQVVQPGYPGGVQYPPAARPPQNPYPPPQQVAPPPNDPNGAGFLPYSPASMASVEQLGEQVRKLEKTLAAQARALRTLVELLVEKGLLSKAEMLRKQQGYDK